MIHNGSTLDVRQDSMFKIYESSFCYDSASVLKILKVTLNHKYIHVMMSKI